MPFSTVSTLKFVGTVSLGIFTVGHMQSRPLLPPSPPSPPPSIQDLASPISQATRYKKKKEEKKKKKKKQENNNNNNNNNPI